MSNCLLSGGLLNRLVHWLSPPRETGLIGAFAYGSVAFPQHGRPISDAQLDLLFVVRDPVSWHFDNIGRNPAHYNFLMQRCSRASEPPPFLKSVITGFPGPQVYYNPLVKFHDNDTRQDVRFKYGIVSYSNVCRDLLNWSHLYVAGRLHKPVLWIPLGTGQSGADRKLFDSLMSAEQHNLLAALSYALLQLPTGPDFFSDFELFHLISSISYCGDWRMIIGEDKKKIQRIVGGPLRLGHFRQLYATAFKHSSLRDLITFLPSSSGDCPENHRLSFLVPATSPEFAQHLLVNLPDRVCDEAAKANRSDLPSRIWLSSLPAEKRQELLTRVVNHTVRRSSLQQTLLGLFTAGPSRSVVYAGAKLRKMFSSMGLVGWR